MSDTKPRKTDVQKLQRAIVDGLEDVKGQDIVVFNTEHLSPLFERVIIASGTSNRQTKALASSISDAVREAGFPKPRVEGEENGEWIIVDCGAAVAHVMQPSIRQYYHLEEIWGGKTVNLKQTAPAKPAAAESTKAAPAKGSKAAKAAADAPVKAKRASKAAEADAEVTTKPKAKGTAAKTTSRSTAKDAVEAPVAKSAGKPAARLASKTVGKAAPVKAAASKTAAPKSAPAKTAARKTTAAAAPAAKVKTLVVGKPAVKKVAAKAPARKVATRKKAS